MHVVPAVVSGLHPVLKGTQSSVRDIAASLGTTFVLDGSVRRSGTALRVAARLIRSATGFVVWSGTYDRPSGDLVAVQDGIAGEVARSLEASVARPP